MQLDSDLVWTVRESSAAGDSLIGVFTSLEKARALVSRLSAGRLEDFRIEAHVLDQGGEAATPWQVTLSRDGSHVETGAFIGCSCSDDEAEFYRHSFIHDGGKQMSVIVLAPTPGVAIATANEYRAWLQSRGLWTDRLQPLQPLEA